MTRSSKAEIRRTLFRVQSAAIAAVLTLAGCGGGGGGGGNPPAPPPATATFSVGGTVTGLTGAGLVLRNNADNRAITADGPFTFATSLASGASYSVTVATRPSAPSQACVIANGAGTVGSANITGIEVICGAAPGRFLYVTADNPVRLAGYAINAITGALSPITGSTPPSSNNAGPLATDPSGSFLYTANAAADVSAYQINAATGALTEVAGSPFAVGGNPSPMTFRPDGAFVYVPYYLSSLAAFAVNPTTGALTPVAGSPYAVGTQPARAIIDAAGKFIYVPSGGSNELYAFSIDAATGALTPVPGSPYALGARSSSLEFGNGGKILYVSSPLNTFPDNSKVMAFTIAADGSLTAVGGSPFAAGVAGGLIQRSPDGKFLFVANAVNGAATITSFAINPVTGALTAAPGPSFQVGSGAVTFAINPAGNRIVALTFAGSAPASIAVDPTTGALSGTFLPAFGYAPLTGLLDRSGLFSYVLQYGGTNVYPYEVDLIGNRVGALPVVNIGTSPRSALIVGSQ